MRISTTVQVILGIGFITAVVAAKLFYVDHYIVPQNGMYPAIPEDSNIWLNKLAYSTPADVKRGDIVAYEDRENGQVYNYVWRFIGLPGEHVQSRGDEILINGKPVPHILVRTEGQNKIFQEQHADCQFEICIEPATPYPSDTAMKLGPDEFFMLGDNRHSAEDSRFLGPVKFRTFIGKKF